MLPVVLIGFTSFSSLFLSVSIFFISRNLSISQMSKLLSWTQNWFYFIIFIFVSVFFSLWFHHSNCNFFIWHISFQLFIASIFIVIVIVDYFITSNSSKVVFDSSKLRGKHQFFHRLEWNVWKFDQYRLNDMKSFQCPGRSASSFDSWCLDIPALVEWGEIKQQIWYMLVRQCFLIKFMIGHSRLENHKRTDSTYLKLSFFKFSIGEIISK